MALSRTRIPPVFVEVIIFSLCQTVLFQEVGIALRLTALPTLAIDGISAISASAVTLAIVWIRLCDFAVLVSAVSSCALALCAYALALAFVGDQSWRLGSVIAGALLLLWAVLAAAIAIGEHNEQEACNGGDRINVVVGAYLFLPWGTPALVGLTAVDQVLLGAGIFVLWLLIQCVLGKVVAPQPRKTRECLACFPNLWFGGSP